MSICSSNRHEFSSRVYRTDMFFQGGSICSSNRPLLFHRTDINFPETLIKSSKTYEFSKNLYFLIEQIFHFPEETLSSPRTHTIFPMPRTDRHFPGRYPPPPSNRYFVNRSQWLLLRLGRQNFVLYIHEHTKHVHIKIPIESVRFEIQVTLNCDSYILPNEKIKSASFWFMARINLLKNKTIDVDDALLW